MSSGSSPEQTPAKPVLRSEESTEPLPEDGGQTEDRLSQILEQILSASEVSGNAAEDFCKKDLLEVAAKYPSLEFCADPILMELVQAITRRMKGLPENRRIAMERSVTASLLDDQVSYGRMQHMWEQLKRLLNHGD